MRLGRKFYERKIGDIQSINQTIPSSLITVKNVKSRTGY